MAQLNLPRGRGATPGVHPSPVLYHRPRVSRTLPRSHPRLLGVLTAVPATQVHSSTPRLQLHQAHLPLRCALQESPVHGGGQWAACVRYSVDGALRCLSCPDHRAGRSRPGAESSRSGQTSSSPIQRPQAGVRLAFYPWPLLVRLLALRWAPP
ncbi:hypothetical protein NDU88_001541 [Pleurodeles waltl]|uniref:Uncharacterized protein n=1 Tax=Pleurodeles waltl TaxID=8319 RepID=A0AAV7WM20_PLEWA|nr:hypothetical protein NDU88_001541 [Pleurodeles waltl]